MSAMTSLLSFEWLKFSKRWMPRIIVLLMIALTSVAFWGEATRASLRPDLFLPRGWLVALTFVGFFAPFFWPVLGGSWAGSEYGWGTIRTILTRRPQRIEHVVTALVVLLIGVGVGTLALLVTGTIAALIVSGLTGNAAWLTGVWTGSFLALLVKGFLTAWFVSGFYLLLAYAAATIFRSAAVGIGVGIGGTFAQLVMLGIFVRLGGVWQTIATHFPYNYTQDVITRVVGSALSGRMAVSSPSDPSAGGSVIALVIYSAILLALTLAAVRVRDVTA
jgi:ABC-2 type transport system permease protein